MALPHPTIPFASALLMASAILASPAAAQGAPATSASAVTMDGAAQKTVIEAVIAKMTAGYVFPDKVPFVAKALRRKLSSGGYASSSDPKSFSTVVTADIQAVAHDKHMTLFWSAEPLPPFGEEAKVDRAETERRQRESARINYAMPRIEVLEGNVGYLKMDGFIAADEAGATFAAAMAFLKHTDAVIFDLRENGGGEPGMVAMAVSYLMPAETHINSFYQRGKPIDDQSWTLPYVPGGRWSTDKPVYVLASNNTGSAAEEFAYDLQQLKRGLVIGAVTWGGANPGDVVAIDRHFAIFIPKGAAVNPISKTNWEGLGVKPDIAVDPKAALTAAHRTAVQRLAATASGERRIELEKLLQTLPGF